MKISWFLLLFVLSVSCSQEKNTEIIQMKNIGGVYKSNVTKELSMYEYFVITNPPKDTIALLELISAFNDSTLSIDSIKKYKSGSYYRAFYEETKKFSRNYEEISGWGSDRIEDHANDRLMGIFWNESKCASKTLVWYASDVYDFFIQTDSVSDDELFWSWKRDCYLYGK
ncbi:hypothetical protein [Geofilum rhodophaeum]|uniref:hypothetical protein n=1 Tax=Geofilum rhodophaeum TaxID=1965019 RepID=UPI000B51F3FC|nr:hypothetical protein [Geofilum rhodophaeum]